MIEQEAGTCSDGKEEKFGFISALGGESLINMFYMWNKLIIKELEW